MKSGLLAVAILAMASSAEAGCFRRGHQSCAPPCPPACGVVSGTCVQWVEQEITTYKTDVQWKDVEVTINEAVYTPQKGSYKYLVCVPRSRVENREYVYPVMKTRVENREFVSPVMKTRVENREYVYPVMKT